MYDTRLYSENNSLVKISANIQEMKTKPSEDRNQGSIRIMCDSVKGWKVAGASWLEINCPVSFTNGHSV